MVDNRLEASEHTSLWPKTRRGAVLYTLAAMVAIVIGVIPALWINRWRNEADAAPPKQIEKPVVMPTVEPIETTPTDQKPAPTEQASAAEPTVPTVEQPAIDMEATVPVAKTTKRPRPKAQRPKPAAAKPAPTKPKPPPCDIYLHPHGCPNG